MLCHKCHLQITLLNSHQARKQRHALANNQRWAIWFKFKDGGFPTQRITHLDREWLEQDERRARLEDERPKWFEGGEKYRDDLSGMPFVE
jgi:hypothetical protein